MSTIKERPIIFSDEMVRAILEGRKTQTRRVVKPQPHAGVRLATLAPFSPSGFEDGHGRSLRCPYGKTGDRLWVREKFSFLEFTSRYPIIKRSLAEGDEHPEVYYWANGRIPGWGNWTRPKPSIHMPRWASRILLEITNVRVERVQEASYEDIMAEGIRDVHWLTAWKVAWNSINAKRGFGWESNPWVWVLEFKKL